MSAAATAAGYLYASGRLRGRGAREQEHAQDEHKPPHAKAPARAAGERPAPRKPVRVAALPASEEAPRAAEPPKRSPRIEYRVRRWHPRQEANGSEPNE